ncbi:MAG: hypothetical protein ACPGR5_01690 [Chitinophagales bacterium]
MHKFIFILSLLPVLVFGQNFRYQKEINGVQSKWHKIQLDKEILSVIKDDFSDLRIFELTPENDTLTVPYFIETPKSGATEKGLNFSILNQSKNADDYFITFEAKNDLKINEIHLSFDEENYNYLLNLEGSQDQKEWFSILEDYRILSIRNKLTDYKFNTLSFPLSLYKYYRVKVKNAEKLNIKSVKILQVENIPDQYIESKTKFKTTNSKNKTTEIEINLGKRVPVSKLELIFNEDEAFYRAIKIQYLLDSVKTEKGYYYNYGNLSRSYASSYESSVYKFETVFTNKLKVIIQNNDNQALKVKSVKTFNLNYEAIARFNGLESTYFLKYGNAKIKAPIYDIVNFKNDIPKELTSLKLSKVKDLQNPVNNDSLFNNKIWLWLIMLVIIVLLAYSSFGMLKKK